MFDLNQAISEWRKKMIAGGINPPAVLDELENHLREDVEQQVRAGASQKQAFDMAVNRIGKSDLLKAEFAKISGLKKGRLEKVIGMACCVFASLYSMVLAPHLFTIHELSPAQRILGLSAVVLTFLSLASWRFSYKFLPIIHNRHTRKMVAITCGLAGLAWLLIFANLLPNVIVPHFMENGASAESVRGGVLIGLRQATPDGFAAIFAIGASLLWAMTIAAILGGVAYGLEEAARRETKQIAA